MKVLILAEHDNQVLKPAIHQVVAAASLLTPEIDLLIMGEACDAVVKQAGQLTGIKKILVADAKDYAKQLAENVAPLVADIGKNYQYILAPSNTYGKNLLPRIAALLDVDMISDVVKIMAPDTFIRTASAGNLLVTVKTEEPIKLMTIRTTAFTSVSLSNTAAIPVEKITKIIPNHLSAWVSQALTISTRPELTTAKIIISGGRGLKSAENFKLLEAIADRLGAAIGASRAAVDAGFVSNDYQVGQTGKIVAPDLYIAVGISGAIQHLAGMKDSKIIVAINNDPEAPIFSVSDYGLVGDLFKILPELQTELDKQT